MLTEKERKVLELRKKGYRQVDIASKLDVSQPAVSAFENNALRKIRDAKVIMDFARKVRIEYGK
ncbi:helix-turn-helix domain-containing protein [Candidatus Woesearchaeota archaeon]|nr:helix-turn-helix domain-containing protein [Candidatus Woesearchaeota archaeon]